MDQELEAIAMFEKINAIDFRAFTVGELNSVSPDVFVKVRSIEKFGKGDRFTLSDAGNFQVHKGSENLYCDVEIFLVDRYSEKLFRLEMYTKEQHDILKAIVKRIVNQL
jgi:hypothetical protein